MLEFKVEGLVVCVFTVLGLTVVRFPGFLTEVVVLLVVSVLLVIVLTVVSTVSADQNATYYKC